MQQVGPYEIPDPSGGRLGEGGMGVVYRAFDPRLRREVALKLVRAAREGDEARARLLREARSAAAIAHPNVATIYEVGEHQGEPFIAMELIAGDSLRARLRAGPLEVEELIRVGRGIARGLSAAHKVGVIHRDLKPSNVMLTEEGRVVLLDFGLAQATPQAQMGPTQSVTLTEEGFTHGTPGYMPPEQSMGYGVDERSDLFALGVTLYECLAGKKPFEGTTPTAIALATLTGKPEDLRRLRPEVPEALASLIHALLEKQPEKRPQSAGAVASELEGMLTETQTTRILQEVGERRRGVSPMVLGGLLAFIVLVAGVGVYLGRSTSGGPAGPPRIVVADIPGGRTAETQGLARMLELELLQFSGLELVEQPRPFSVDQARAALAAGAADQIVIGAASVSRGVVTLELRLESKDGSGAKIEVRKEGATPAVSTAATKLSQKIDGAKRVEGSVLTQNIDAYRAYEQGEKSWYGGDTRSALNRFREAVELDKGFALAHYRIALCLKWIGDPEAKAYARRALELVSSTAEQPGRREATMLRALVAELSGDEGAARLLYDEVLKAYPRDRDALFRRGDLAYHGGRHMEAVGYFRRIVNLDASYLSAYQHYIWALLRSGRRGEVPAALDDFLARHRTTSAFIAAGRGWMRVGALSKADEVLAQCMELHDRHNGCASHRAGALLFLGEHAAAERLLEEQMGLLGVHNANEFTLADQIRLFTLEGKLKHAEALLRTRTTTLDTAVARAFHGRWLLEQGRVDEAAALLRPGDLDPFEVHVAHAHLLLALSRGDLERARVIAARAPRPEDYRVLIDTHDGCAASTSAISELQAALAQQEVFRERYALNFARCLVRAGRDDEAIAALQALRAEYVFGDEAAYARPAALALLVELQVKRGDLGAARSVADELLELRSQGDRGLPDVERVQALMKPSELKR